MKIFLFLFLSLTALLSAQTHQRYTITLPSTVSSPYVAELLVPSNGKMVAISTGGNHDTTTNRVSWGVLNTPTSTLWFEMIFPKDTTPAPSGSVLITSANGSTLNLTPTSAEVPRSALALLAAPETPLNLSADEDDDGLSFLLEHMLKLSDQQKNGLMNAFEVRSAAGGVTLSASYQSVDGYEILIRPVLGTAPMLPTVMLGSDYLSTDGNRLEIPNLPQTFLFTIAVLNIAE